MGFNLAFKGLKNGCTEHALILGVYEGFLPFVRRVQHVTDQF